MVKLDFAEWLKKEMTSCAAVAGGGGTYTNDVAKFSRPLGSVVRRKWADGKERKKKN